MKDLILIGGGGHCKVCIEVIEKLNKFKIIGILDRAEKIGQKILGHTIIGTDTDIENYAEKDVSFFITIGQLTSANDARCRLFNMLDTAGFDLPAIISEHAQVSSHADVEKGSVVLSSAVVNADAVVKENCIINTRALIEHDAVIGNNSHISTGALINGNCKIGHNCMVGSGAVLKNGISVAPFTTIGMGAVVTKDITEPGIYYGNPARKISL